MIQSFAMVKQQRPDARLYIIGPYDEDPEYYQECCETMQYQECEGIHFVGRAKVEEWLPSLDMVILTSISEGQPFVLMEAMAAHRPVLATNVGGCRELIEGDNDGLGMAGKIVPIMSPAQIAAGILELGERICHMRELAENGYQRVVRFYQDVDFLRRYDALYRSLRQVNSEEVARQWLASVLN